MNNMMPDPISSLGRAVQARTSQMPPDQVAQLDQQYSQMGLTSINDVISLKQQLDRMKQGGQMPQVPQTTVMQDLQQQAGGLAGLATPNVGNPQSYARGGIVAFASGGSGRDTVKADFAAGPRTMTAADLGLTAEEAALYNRLTPEQQMAYRYENLAEVGPKQNFRSRVGTALRKPRSIKEVAGKVGRGVKGAYLPAAGITAGLEGVDALTGNAVPTENMREYYRGLGLNFIDPASGDNSLMGDLGVRTLGELHRVGTLGFFGPQKNEPDGNEPVAETKTDQTMPIDLSQFMSEDDGSGFFIPGSVGRAGFDSSGFNQADDHWAKIEAAKRAEAKAGRMPQFMELSEDAKKAGLGAIYEQELAKLKEKEAAMAGDAKRDKWLSAADGFFEMARAAGEDGATFMGSLGAGGAKGTQSYRDTLDKEQARRDNFDQQRLQLGMAQDQQKTGFFNTADQRVQAADAAADAAGGNRANIAMDRSKVAMDVAMNNARNETSKAIAQFEAGSRDKALSSVKRAAAIAQNLKEKAWSLPPGEERDRYDAAAGEVLDYVGQLAASIMGYADPRVPGGKSVIDYKGLAGAAANGNETPNQNAPQYLGVER